MTDKILGIIFGGGTVLVLILFGWWLMWDGNADKHILAVRQSIARQEYIWDKGGQNVELRYSEIVALGYPFTTEIRVLHPSLRTTLNGQKFRIQAPFLSFYPADEDRWQYEVEFLPDFTVTMGNDEYYIHLYALPKMLIYAPPTKLYTPNASQYGTILPADFLVGIDRGKSTRKAQFQTMPTPEHVWRVTPANIGPALSWFATFLQTAAGR